MKKIILVGILALSTIVGYSQKFHLKNNGQPIDKKLEAALRYSFSVVNQGEEDYQIEVFFTGNNWKGHKGYYRLYDKNGTELYKSSEWKVGGYGGTAENRIVKKVVDKDLPVALKKLKKENE